MRVHRADVGGLAQAGGLTRACARVERLSGGQFLQPPGGRHQVCFATCGFPGPITTPPEAWLSGCKKPRTSRMLVPQIWFCTCRLPSAEDLPEVRLSVNTARPAQALDTLDGGRLSGPVRSDRTEGLSFVDLVTSSTAMVDAWTLRKCSTCAMGFCWTTIRSVYNWRPNDRTHLPLWSAAE